MESESILTPRGLLYLHYRIVERTGGTHGVRDPHLLRGALVRPTKRLNDRELFPTPFSKAAVLMHALATTGPFHDANRRTALAAALLVLAEHGYECDVSADDARAVMGGVSSGQLSFGELSDWLEVNSRMSTRP